MNFKFLKWNIEIEKRRELKPLPPKDKVTTYQDAEEHEKLNKLPLIYFVGGICFMIAGFILKRYIPHETDPTKIAASAPSITVATLENVAELFTHVGLGFFIAFLVDIGTHRVFKNNIKVTIQREFSTNLPISNLQNIISTGIIDCTDISTKGLISEMIEYLRENPDGDKRIKCLALNLLKKDGGINDWCNAFEELILDYDCNVEFVLPSYKLINNSLLCERSKAIFGNDGELIEYHEATIKAIQKMVKSINEKASKKGKASTLGNKKVAVRFHSSYITFPQICFGDYWYKGFYFPHGSASDEKFLKIMRKSDFGRRLQSGYESVYLAGFDQNIAPDFSKGFKIISANKKASDDRAKRYPTARSRRNVDPYTVQTETDWIEAHVNPIIKENAYTSSNLLKFCEVSGENHVLYMITDAKNDIYGHILILPIHDMTLVKARLKEPGSLKLNDWTVNDFIIEQLFAYDEYFHQTAFMLYSAVEAFPTILSDIFKEKDTSKITIWAYYNMDNKDDIRNQALDLLGFAPMTVSGRNIVAINLKQLIDFIPANKAKITKAKNA